MFYNNFIDFHYFDEKCALHTMWLPKIRLVAPCSHAHFFAFWRKPAWVRCFQHLVIQNAGETHEKQLLSQQRVIADESLIEQTAQCLC